MPNYQVISKSSHAGMRWRKFNSYSHARTDAIAPLVLKEFPTAARDLPIAFMEVESSFVPVAIQGIQPGKNLLVAADGRWLGGYVPAKYRCYPFALANTEDGQQVLCVDEDSGLLTRGVEGQALFNEDGSPSEDTNNILGFLSAIEANREPTANLCSILKKYSLLQPWPIRVVTQSGQIDIGGMFRIDQEKLNTVAIEALDEIRQMGALPIVYLQLMSMRNLAILGRLADISAKNESLAQSLPDTLNLDFLNDSGNISFGDQ